MHSSKYTLNVHYYMVHQDNNTLTYSLEIRNLLPFTPSPSSSSSCDFLDHFCFYDGNIHHAFIEEARVSLKYTRINILSNNLTFLPLNCLKSTARTFPIMNIEHTLVILRTDLAGCLNLATDGELPTLSSLT